MVEMTLDGIVMVVVVCRVGVVKLLMLIVVFESIVVVGMFDALPVD